LEEHPLARIIVVTSGKGGVGKTTTSAAIAMGLAKKGHKTAVIDFDVGLRNLDLIMGCERRVVYDFINVVNGEATLNQALIKDKNCGQLYILPASQTRDKDALSKEGVEKVLDELSKTFKYIVCDSPAGIEKGAHLAMLGLMSSKSRRAEQNLEPIKEYLLLSRYSPERVKLGEMLSVDDVQEILSLHLLGVIPESKSVLNASNAGIPIILDEKSDAGQAYADIVARYLGEEKPHRFIEDKKGFFGKLFGGK
jgi:septum site-determining protein MinD